MRYSGIFQTPGETSSLYPTNEVEGRSEKDKLLMPQYLSSSICTRTLQLSVSAMVPLHTQKLLHLVVALAC
jgi:hypothetical protein